MIITTYIRNISSGK